MHALTLLKSAYLKIGTILPLGVLLVTSGEAQEFVSTNPQDQKVVLEEFTGLNCTWCPAGHKIADDLKNKHPNSVFLVNIHTGGFARPSGSQPDFRTGLGSAIDDLMNVSGYPSATVNRKPYNGNKALSRSDWEAAANQVLNQPSPVNVAVKTAFDENTRELEVKVEAYYTDSSKSNTNRLNVAVLQNEIPGPQVDGSNSYPENYYSNNQYIHKHMLRDFLSGQWGDVIDHPFKDSLFTKTYTYQVPKEYRGVPVKPQFLQVTAYVAEGKENVYTGTTEKVSVDQSLITDISVAQSTEPPEDYCDQTLAPKYTVVNNGSKTIESFTATIKFDGSKQTKTFAPVLSPGASSEIVFDEVTIPGGEFELQFNDFHNINDNTLFDDNVENNFPDEVSTGYAFAEHPFWKEAKALFDNGSIPEHFALDNSGNPNSAAYYNPRNPAGANSSNGALYQFLDQSIDNTENPNHLIFGRVDLSKWEDPYFTYFYSFTKGNKNVDELPKLRLQISDDCGESWDTVKTNTLEETVSFSPSGNTYIPSSDDYVKIWYPLGEEYQEKDDVIFRATIEPGDNGHIVWFDEFKMGSKSKVAGVANEELASNISLYPNPVSKDQATVNFDLDQERKVGVDIVNAQGKTVKEIHPQTFSQGKSQININTDSLNSGVYVAKITTADHTVTKKFVIAE